MDGTGLLFQPLVSALMPQYQCVVHRYDPYRADGYDELLGQLEDELLTEELDTRVLVAESFSGPLAIRFAAKHNVAAVVLCATFATSPLRGLGLLAGLARPRLLALTPRWVASRALLSGGADATIGPLLREALGQVAPAVLAKRVTEVAKVNVTAELCSLKAPVMYLEATDDWVVGRRNRLLIQRLRPDAVLERVSGPHLVLQVQPEEVARRIHRFLESVAA